MLQNRHPCYDNSGFDSMKRIVATVGDSEKMPLESEQYQVVTCNMSIHHYCKQYDADPQDIRAFFLYDLIINQGLSIPDISTFYIALSITFFGITAIMSIARLNNPISPRP